MKNKHTRRGLTQTQESFYRSGFNLTQDASKPQNAQLSGHALTYDCHQGFTTFPLEGEDVRRTKEGVWNKLGCITPLPASGHPLPQGARMTTRGFTLIELLVVVLIIGILAAVALPQYQQAVLKTRYQQAIILGNLFYKAQKIYYLEHGSYAKSFDDFTVTIPQPIRQTTTSTDMTLYYPLGVCTMRFINTGLPDIQCKTKDIEYEVKLNGTRACHAYSEVSRKLCQAETGHEPFYQGTMWWSWHY